MLKHKVTYLLLMSLAMTIQTPIAGQEQEKQISRQSKIIQFLKDKKIAIIGGSATLVALSSLLFMSAKYQERISRDIKDNRRIVLQSYEGDQRARKTNNRGGIGCGGSGETKQGDEWIETPSGRASSSFLENMKAFRNASCRFYVPFLGSIFLRSEANEYANLSGYVAHSPNGDQEGFAFGYEDDPKNPLNNERLFIKSKADGKTVYQLK